MGNFLSRGLKRETYDVAKGEERVALHDVAGHVAAVVALADDALVALDVAAESVLAAHEDEGHDGLRLGWYWAFVRPSVGGVLK